jgi:hypothetical protein
MVALSFPQQIRKENTKNYLKELNFVFCSIIKADLGKLIIRWPTHVSVVV